MFRGRKEYLATWPLTKEQPWPLFAGQGGARWLQMSAPADMSLMALLFGGVQGPEPPCRPWGDLSVAVGWEWASKAQADVQRVLGSNMGIWGGHFGFNSSPTNKKSVLTSFQRTSRSWSASIPEQLWIKSLQSMTILALETGAEATFSKWSSYHSVKIFQGSCNSLRASPQEVTAQLAHGKPWSCGKFVSPSCLQMLGRCLYPEHINIHFL